MLELLWLLHLGPRLKHIGFDNVQAAMFINLLLKIGFITRVSLSASWYIPEGTTAPRASLANKPSLSLT